MENVKNKNGFLITCVSCIALLLLMCYFGINSSSTLKGTQAASTCSSGTAVGDYCCPTGYTAGVTSAGVCYSDEYKAGGSGYCSRLVPASGKSTLESAGWTCTVNSTAAANVTYTCTTSALSNCTASNVGTPSSSTSVDYTNGYACWFCSGGYKWQVGQNGCQYPVTSVTTSSQCDDKNSEVTYTATFNANGGSLSGSSSLSCTTTTGYSCTISGLPTATRSGYTFKGWAYSTTASSGNTGSMALTSSATLYAAWVSNSTSSSATKQCYQCNGSSNVFYWGTSTSNSDAPSCGGGWHTRTDLTAATCVASQCYQCNGDSSLYYWGPSTSGAPTCGGGWHTRTDLTQSQCVGSTTYTATFDGNGGTASKSSVSCTSSQGSSCTITAPTATRSCYSFKGWAGSSTATSGTTGTLTLTKSNTKYYATWSYVGCGSGGTSSPTSTPTSTPTGSKTSNPTSTPTSNPTSTPTSKPSSNVDENPQTGQIAIFVVWVVALAAIVYSVWYFRKVKEN